MRSTLQVGPGDDAAVLADGMAWTVDTLIEGVHFDRRLSAEDVGYKALAVSVSDLVAMGAEPKYALLALSVPAEDAFVDGFSTGFGQAARAFGVDLIGGDTTRAPVRVASVSLGGPLVDRPLRRDAGQPGDVVFVTGELGFAGEGWAADSPSTKGLTALRRPKPPVEFGLALARCGIASCGMDLSDGLGVDLPRLCAASRVGATIDGASIPGHPSLQYRVFGGEDYQLLFASPEPEAVEVLGRRHQTQVSRIGTLTPGSSVELTEGWPAPLFAHFGEAS